MRVLVLSGGTGGEGCHVEVFEDSETGRKSAETRKAELKALNGGHWNLKLEPHLVKM